MKQYKSQKIIYSICVADVQTVAEEEIGRKLTREEIDSIRDSIADNIDWFEAIADSIRKEISSTSSILQEQELEIE